MATVSRSSGRRQDKELTRMANRTTGVPKRVHKNSPLPEQRGPGAFQKTTVPKRTGRKYPGSKKSKRG